jgi:hypothetical protein
MPMATETRRLQTCPPFVTVTNAGGVAGPSGTASPGAGSACSGAELT